MADMTGPRAAIHTFDRANKMKRKPPTIHEMKAGDRYIYFARINGNWVDLAPWGNRIPTTEGLVKSL